MFGEESVGLMSLVEPRSEHVKPELTYELMIHAAMIEYADKHGSSDKELGRKM